MRDIVEARLVLVLGPAMTQRPFADVEAAMDIQQRLWIHYTEPDGDDIEQAMMEIWAGVKPFWRRKLDLNQRGVTWFSEDAVSDEEIATAIREGTFQHFGDHVVLDEDVGILYTQLCYVNVYHITREFGGPEEGGWWYNHHQLKACIPTTIHEAEVVKGLMLRRYAHLHDDRPLSSVLSEGALEITIDDTPGSTEPARRPHYE